jgi:hypothetical protein
VKRVAKALVVASVVVMVDEGSDLPFEVAQQAVVLEQDAVLKGLVPALDLALGLGMKPCTPDVIHPRALGQVRQVAGDV